ncbi:MAG: hypothetical protein HY721_30750 [Planctomycetes bacterium]|nr:hypothetical protein [Planctomycetota bacterium]
MTTIPSRIGGIPRTVRSLVAQVERPDAIYLHVPAHSVREDRPYDLGPIESELSGCRVTVLLGLPDDGPITKLLPLLDAERAPGTLLVLADDDTEYGPLNLRNLYEHRRLRAAGFSGRDFVLGPGGRLDSLPHRVGANGVSRVAFLEGISGALYERSVFPASAQELRDWLRTLPSEARYNDDIVIGAYLSHRGVKRHLVTPRKGSYWIHDNEAPLALSQTGNLQWRNSYVFEALYRMGYYRERGAISRRIARILGASSRHD